MEWLRENAAQVAPAIPYVLVAIALVALAATWLLRPRNGLLQQSPRFRRALRVLAVLSIPGPLIGLGVVFGPMSPLFKSIRQLRAHKGAELPDVVFQAVKDNRQH